MSRNCRGRLINVELQTTGSSCSLCQPAQLQQQWHLHHASTGLLVVVAQVSVSPPVSISYRNLNHQEVTKTSPTSLALKQTMYGLI